MRQRLVTTTARIDNMVRASPFHSLEAWLSRGGLAVLGFGIWWPIDTAKNVGFLLVALAFAMHIVGMITRRVRRETSSERS